jgi:8-oxo-dGTP diphosphatase
MADRALMVNVVLFSLRDESLQVLLAPQAERWELPGEAVGESEALEETANRVLATMIKRREAYLEQLYTYGNPAREARQATVRVIYFALVPAGTGLLPGTVVKWAAVTSLPPLVGDQADIVTYALRRLRYKLEYSAVGFQLLPQEFTLSELQHTYEIILDERLDKRNFRRRILASSIIEETSRLRTGEGRPARLYRYRPDAVAEVKARRLFP